MFKLTAVLLALGICPVSFGGTVETSKVPTPRGAVVTVAMNLPDKPSAQNATVVIAPGQGYHMDLPIIKGLAEKLASRGIIAIRFNWNYFSAGPKKGQPSSDLSNEMEDMKAVIAFAKADARVDKNQLLFAGKSLGSKVSYQVFSKDASAKALILMTPVCTSSYDDNDKPLPTPIPVGALNYRGLPSTTRPIVMTLGNADPLCSLPMLYEFLKDTKGNVSTVVVGGDHGWNMSSATDPVSVQRNSDNVAEGVQVVAHWINLILGR